MNVLYIPSGAELFDYFFVKTLNDKEWFVKIWKEGDGLKDREWADAVFYQESIYGNYSPLLRKLAVGKEDKYSLMVSFNVKPLIYPERGVHSERLAFGTVFYAETEPIETPFKVVSRLPHPENIGYIDLDDFIHLARSSNVKAVELYRPQILFCRDGVKTAPTYFDYLQEILD